MWVGVLKTVANWAKKKGKTDKLPEKKRQEMAWKRETFQASWALPHFTSLCVELQFRMGETD